MVAGFEVQHANALIVCVLHQNILKALKTIWAPSGVKTNSLRILVATVASNNISNIFQAWSIQKTPIFDGEVMQYVRHGAALSISSPGDQV